MTTQIPYRLALFAMAALALIASGAAAQQPLETELLVNAGFETGDLTAWSASSGNILVASYGGADLPPASVAAQIGGGTSIARPDPASSTISVIEQIFDVSGNAADIDADILFIRLGGAFGESPSSAGRARLRARFLNATGGPLGAVDTGDISATNLNGLTSVLTRFETFAVPAMTRTIEVELDLRRNASATSYADNLSAVLTTNPTPPALPLNTELLPETNFEGGSLYDPADPSSWVVQNAPGLSIVGYGSPGVPSVARGAQISGGSLLLRRNALTSGSTVTAKTTIDVRGNAADIDAGLVALRMAGYFGESGNFGGTADMIARFRNDVGTQIGTFTVGNVTQAQLNGEIWALFRSDTNLLPVGTRLIDIDLQLLGNDNDETAFVDNLSATLVSPPGVSAPVPLDTNLLVQGDLEDGLFIDPNNESGWLVTSNPGFDVVPYGSSDVPLTNDGLPGPAVGSLVRRASDAAFSGTAIALQTIDVSGNAADIDAGLLALQLRGNFGESTAVSGNSTLIARLRNAAGSQLATFTIGNIDFFETNNVALAAAQVDRLDIPAGTRSIDVELRISSQSTGETAFADNLSAIISTPATLDVTQPLNTELLTQIDFEDGVIIDPTDSSGWLVASGPGFSVVAYGDPNLPSTAIGAQQNGGNFLLTRVLGDPTSSISTMRQIIDVTGNAAAIDQGALVFRLSGDFGEPPASINAVNGRIRFRNAAGTQVGTFTLDQITSTNLNGETTAARRSTSSLVPVDTRSIDVEISLRGSGAGSDEYADNLSGMLLPLGSEFVSSGVELLANGDFESGSVITPGDLGTWLVASGAVEIVDYGTPNTPSTAIAAAVGGGSSLLRVPQTGSNGSPTLERIIKVDDNAAEIDAGDLGIHVEALLGGLGSDSDNARVDIDFLNAVGSQIATETLGSVTATDRSNMDAMLFREGDFVLPVGTRRIRIEIRFFTGGADRVAFVDSVSVRFDNETFPGSREDLELATGINGPATVGPFVDLKTATAGDIIVLSTSSPLGTHDFQPLNLLTQLFTAGSPPASPGGFPNTHVNPLLPNLFVLLNGAESFGIFGPPIVIPGGTILQLQTPTGLAGFEAIFQSLVITPSAANGFFVTSNAHLITFL